MTSSNHFISVRGKQIAVAGTSIGGHDIVVTGRFLKIAVIKDQDWYGDAGLADPLAFARQVTTSGLVADLFAFSDLDGGFGLAANQARTEPDNVAVAEVGDYQKWWASLPQEARKNVRRAGKRGVTIRAAPFSSELVAGIKSIYDESPVRQGRRFWHYGKSLDIVAKENGTFLDRCDFLGAYREERLIGFVKLVYVGADARMMQIVCLNSERDSRPIVALINAAAEVSHKRGCRYLIYGKFSYGRRSDSTLAEFKRRLGFSQLDFPRYFVPLTMLGRIALRLRLHQGLTALLPSWLLEQGIAARARLVRLADSPANASRTSNEG